MIFHISVPPSANNLYANVDGKGRVKSAEYRKWITAAGWEAKALTAGQPRLGKKVLVRYLVPVNGRRDIDNYIKPMNDLLKRVGLIEDDRHIESVVIGRWAGDNVSVELAGVDAA